MKFILQLILFYYILYLSYAELKFKNQYDIWKLNSSALTNTTQFTSLRCVSTQTINKINYIGVNLRYPQLCSYRRSYSQRVTYNFIFKNSTDPVPTVLHKICVNETRDNGTLMVLSVGYIESGVRQLVGTAFIEQINYPNFKGSFACNSVDGLTLQVGTAQFILAQVKPQNLGRLFLRYNPAQLFAIFRKRANTNCLASSIILYNNGLMDENLIRTVPTNQQKARREITESYVENLSECERWLSFPVLRITDIKQISIEDTCDSVNLSDRYKNDLNRFVVYTTHNSSNSVSVRIIYKNANRIKGTFSETAIGVVIDGPSKLLGMAYMRVAVIPNLNQFDCISEPGVTELVGSSEIVISNINVKNLISISNIDSLIAKFRTNRLIDCIGFISVIYSPGLLSSDSDDDDNLNQLY